AYDNGSTCEAGGPHYCMGAGLEVSGNDEAALADSSNFVVGGIFFHNFGTGAGNYGAAKLEIWQGTFYRTNYGRSDLRSLTYDSTADTRRIYDSVDQRASGMAAFAYNNAGLTQLNRTPLTASSCFAPIAADSEALGINGSPGIGTYAAPPAWIGSSNLVG